MRAVLIALLLLFATACAQDVEPGANREGVVHVNAIKNPEIHSYRAIAAGLDTFDAQHALAPDVPQLRFAVRRPGGAQLEGDLPTAKLTADAFTLALPVGTDALFDVPRSQQAWDANAELVLSRKRKEVRVWPHVRTTWSVNVESPLASAVLREGERMLPLKVKNRQFELPLYDPTWGNDAVVDLAFVAPEGAAP